MNLDFQHFYFRVNYVDDLPLIKLGIYFCLNLFQIIVIDYGICLQLYVPFQILINVMGFGPEFSSCTDMQR